MKSHLRCHIHGQKQGSRLSQSFTLGTAGALAKPPRVTWIGIGGTRSAGNHIATHGDGRQKPWGNSLEINGDLMVI